jgi:predicted aminopeptidase
MMAMLSGCSPVSYYAQAVGGQISLLIKREPIVRVMEDRQSSPELVRQLNLISDALIFAEQSLGLPVGGSYSSFVRIDRPHLVWNVFAAPAFSVQPLHWCFPVAGCVSYRGYFKEAAAQRFADQLYRQGYDVYVGGVDAYSTLGWFDDPIPSTILRRADHRIVGLIFHELAHQIVYLPGDTVFNESFATFVEQQGLHQWLRARDDLETYQRYLAEQELQREFTDFVSGYRKQFAALYAEPAEARAQKQALQESMRAEWFAKTGGQAYRAWFEGPLNNAQLATVSAYNDFVPAFEQLFEQSGQSLTSFYERAQELARQPADRRQQLLAVLSGQAEAQPLED